MTEIDHSNSSDDKPLSRDDILTFKAPGRTLHPDDIAREFQLMRSFYKNVFTAEVARSVCLKSGTHLIKMVSPRVDGHHSVLRFFPKTKEDTPQVFIPSVNAADIPFAKIIFRPLEIMDFPTQSLVDHLLNPSSLSERVLDAFASVFGRDVLDAITQTLTDPLPDITKLSDREFPIVFIPSPSGGDLQITPVSPATAYMGVKSVTGEYFQKQVKGAPKVPRGRWHRQAVTSKPQNISGAIGGPRTRFMAEMPREQGQYEAEIYKFLNGGRFPRWNNPDVAGWVQIYAKLVDRSETFNNRDTRAGVNRLIDSLIGDAKMFIEETLVDARISAEKLDLNMKSLPVAPSVQSVILRRKWDCGTFDVARRVLNGEHFAGRMKKQADEGLSS